MSDSLKKFEEAQRTYLRENGWVLSPDKTDGGWEVWIDKDTLFYCTRPCAIDNQLRREGFYGEEKRGKFNTGLMRQLKAPQEVYDQLA